MAASSSVPSSDMKSRHNILEGLDTFIENCQANTLEILDKLGWTPEHFLQSKNLVQCAFSNDHRVPKKTLVQHEHTCELVQQGYSKQEASLIAEDQSLFYKGSSCVYSIKLDKQTLNTVLWNHHSQNQSVFYGYEKMPLTSEEESQLLSREDRLGLSEFIIRRAKEANRLKELGQDELLVSENLADLIKKDDDNSRHLDHVEEMAALRDYRRRRQTYRAKNVHITRKSHTEIMREVINNQMEMYSKSLSGVDEENDSAELAEGTIVKQEPYEDERMSHDWTGKSHDVSGDQTHGSIQSQDRYSRGSSRQTDYSDTRHGRHSSSYRQSRYSDSSRDQGRHRDRGRSNERDRRERSCDRSRDRSYRRDISSQDQGKRQDINIDERDGPDVGDKEMSGVHEATDDDVKGKETMSHSNNGTQTSADISKGQGQSEGDDRSQGIDNYPENEDKKKKKKKRKREYRSRSRSRNRSRHREKSKKHKKHKHKHSRDRDRESDSE